MTAIDTVFDHLATSLAAGVDAISAAAVAQARGEAPEWLVDKPDLGDLLPTGTRASIGAELAAFRAETLPDELPAIDADGARLSARTGVPLSRHLALYQIGHAAQWQAWFELVENEEFDPVRRRALLERGSRFFFAYADWISRLAGTEHQRERDRLLRSHEQRRVHLVRELLDGRDDIDVGALDYPLDANHLGLVVSGHDAPAVARALAARVNRRLLLVELVQDTWWGWLGGRHALARGNLPRGNPPPGVQIAHGEDAPGLDGFRRTHREAVDAYRVGRDLGCRTTSYDDVVLHVLLERLGDDAARFAKCELRGIDGEDARASTLRDTLASYYAHDQNAAATAAALDVHEQTIAKRLRAIERHTGRSVTQRRAELELALRLRQRRTGAPVSPRKGAKP